MRRGEFREGTSVELPARGSAPPDSVVVWNPAARKKAVPWRGASRTTKDEVSLDIRPAEF